MQSKVKHNEPSRSKAKQSIAKAWRKRKNYSDGMTAKNIKCRPSLPFGQSLAPNVKVPLNHLLAFRRSAERALKLRSRRLVGLLAD